MNAHIITWIRQIKSIENSIVTFSKLKDEPTPLSVSRKPRTVPSLKVDEISNMFCETKNAYRIPRKKTVMI